MFLVLAIMAIVLGGSYTLIRYHTMWAIALGVMALGVMLWENNAANFGPWADRFDAAHPRFPAMIIGLNKNSGPTTLTMRVTNTTWHSVYRAHAVCFGHSETDGRLWVPIATDYSDAVVLPPHSVANLVFEPIFGNYGPDDFQIEQCWVGASDKEAWKMSTCPFNWGDQTGDGLIGADEVNKLCNPSDRDLASSSGS